MSQKLNVAVYHNLHSGGAKHSMYEIVRRLAQRHRVDLFRPGTADTTFFDVQEFVEGDVLFDFRPGRLFRSPFGRLNQVVRWHDLARLEQVERRIAAEIDQRGYDVVYVQPCRFTRHPSLLYYLQTPSVYHSREPFRRFYEPPHPRLSDDERGWRAWLDRADPLIRLYNRRLQATERRNIGSATYIVTNSYFTREALYRIYGVNARVVYHGVALDVFRPLTVPKEDIVLGVGALTPTKGFDFVIDSLSRVAESIRPELVVVSNYQELRERTYLESLAADKRVRLTMRTMIEVDDLVRLYNEARATVCAQVLEPFGLVPLESMACGTPVVAVAEGGLRESVTNGRTGLLVDRDPAEFAAAVERLLTDSVLAERLGQQGRADVCERWTWEQTVHQIERHLYQAR